MHFEQVPPGNCYACKGLGNTRQVLTPAYVKTWKELLSCIMYA